MECLLETESTYYDQLRGSLERSLATHADSLTLGDRPAAVASLAVVESRVDSLLSFIRDATNQMLEDTAPGNEAAA